MSSLTTLRQRISTLRDELQARREARTEYLALQQQLASYSTAHEVDDLLGVIAHQDGPEAQQIRDILLDNLRPAVNYRLA